MQTGVWKVSIVSMPRRPIDRVSCCSLLDQCPHLFLLPPLTCPRLSWILVLQRRMRGSLLSGKFLLWCWIESVCRDPLFVCIRSSGHVEPRLLPSAHTAWSLNTEHESWSGFCRGRSNRKQDSLELDVRKWFLSQKGHSTVLEWCAYSESRNFAPKKQKRMNISIFSRYLYPKHTVWAQQHLLSNEVWTSILLVFNPINYKGLLIVLPLFSWCFISWIICKF